MKKCILIFLVLLSFSAFAQTTINNYKYVIVPEKFSFLKQNDQYRLNTLTRALLQDKGFTVYFDNADLPTEIANNKCNALVVELLEKNSMFSTNLTMLLKDCRGKVIFESKQGKSREKEYTVSYNLALRDAFSSLSDTPYTYVPSAEAESQPGAVSANTSAIGSAPAAATTPASNGTSQATPGTASAPGSASTNVVTSAAVIPGSVNVANVNSAGGTAQVSTQVSNQSGSTTRTVNPVKGKAAISESKFAAGTLYAQSTANGYQLIDTAPKIILTLYKTSAADYFIAGNGTTNGIVFKKNDSWVFEYYNGGELIAEKLLIKF
jgi:hypothetical protein